MENDGKVRDLRLRPMDFARRIVRLFAALPKGTLAQTLGTQVLRSGTSVGANYREADNGRSKPEFIAKMGDCLRELAETDCWLELMAAEEIVSADRLAPLMQETRELIGIFTTIIKKARNQLISEFSISLPSHHSPF
jgi:four helix bundle protein